MAGLVYLCGELPLLQLVTLMRGSIGLEDVDDRTLFWFEVPFPDSVTVSVHSSPVLPTETTGTPMLSGSGGATSPVLLPSGQIYPEGSTATASSTGLTVSSSSRSMAKSAAASNSSLLPNGLPSIISPSQVHNSPGIAIPSTIPESPCHSNVSSPTAVLPSPKHRMLSGDMSVLSVESSPEGTVAGTPFQPARKGSSRKALSVKVGNVVPEDITVPAAATPTSTAPLGVAKSKSPQRQLRVLVVDDEMVNRRLCLRMLQRQGCVAEALEDGDMILTRLLRDRAMGNDDPVDARTVFDVILLDIMMQRTNVSLALSCLSCD